VSRRATARGGGGGAKSALCLGVEILQDGGHWTGGDLPIHLGCRERRFAAVRVEEDFKELRRECGDQVLSGGISFAAERSQTKEGDLRSE